MTKKIAAPEHATSEGPPQIRCEHCLGSGLKVSANGLLTICASCLGWGIIPDLNVMEFCRFEFFSEWQKIWKLMVDAPMTQCEVLSEEM